MIFWEDRETPKIKKVIRLGHDLSKIQSETKNKQITRDGTNFSLTGNKHEEQP